MGVLCCTPSKKEKERWQLCYWECTKPERGAYPRQPLKNLQRQKKTSLRLSNSQVDITHQVQISNWSHSHCYSRKRTWPHLSVAAEFIQQTGRPFVLAHWIGLKGKKKKTPQKLLELFYSRPFAIYGRLLQQLGAYILGKIERWVLPPLIFTFQREGFQDLEKGIPESQSRQKACFTLQKDLYTFQREKKVLRITGFLR